MRYSRPIDPVVSCVSRRRLFWSVFILSPVLLLKHFSISYWFYVSKPKPLLFGMFQDIGLVWVYGSPLTLRQPVNLSWLTDFQGWCVVDVGQSFWLKLSWLDEWNNPIFSSLHTYVSFTPPPTFADGWHGIMCSSLWITRVGG